MALAPKGVPPNFCFESCWPKGFCSESSAPRAMLRTPGPAGYYPKALLRENSSVLQNVMLRKFMSEKFLLQNFSFAKAVARNLSHVCSYGPLCSATMTLVLFLAGARAEEFQQRSTTKPDPLVLLPSRGASGSRALYNNQILIIPMPPWELLSCPPDRRASFKH